ncbi:hypothetical protein ABLE92_23045 [Gordonia sp. VNQ95]|jgi:DNA-binding NarL/FixJ family response regulator|uniref:hypothetical protein n=1 Tax=Gordonia sp. VNQ95 TaxID=3156619 RepID=UPI0032B57113
MVTAGVAAVVSKTDAFDNLLEALDAAVSGRKWMTPTMARSVLDDRDATRPELSPREIEALRLYACGKKLGSVARRMGTAPSNAKRYADGDRRKCESVGFWARTRSELCAAATEDGHILRDAPIE